MKEKIHIKNKRTGLLDLIKAAHTISLKYKNETKRIHQNEAEFTQIINSTHTKIDMEYRKERQDLDREEENTLRLLAQIDFQNDRAVSDHGDPQTSELNIPHNFCDLLQVSKENNSTNKIKKIK